MRTLTIKRQKTFVGCAAKMKIYIEDATSQELDINDVPCRKLGELKNGEEKKFLVEERSAKIFVIADKVSRNYCNDCYNLPEGDEDIFLSGKNKFNLGNGNAFRFDGVTDREILANRKRGSKKGTIVLIAALAIGLVVGGIVGKVGTGLLLSKLADSQQKAEKEFVVMGGFSIKLTEAFEEVEADGFTACFGSKDVAVLVLREGFSLLEGSADYSVDEYGSLVLKSNQMDASVQLQHQDGLTFFEYDNLNADTKESYHYISFLYKAQDAFWMVQFATPIDSIEDYRSTIMDWADTVAFEGLIV